MTLHVKMVDIKKFSLTVFSGNDYDFLDSIPISFEAQQKLCKANGRQQQVPERLQNLCSRTTNIRLLAEKIRLEAQSYSPKDSKRQDNAMVARVQLKSLCCLFNKPK